MAGILWIRNLVIADLFVIQVLKKERYLHGVFGMIPCFVKVYLQGRRPNSKVTLKNAILINKQKTER